MQKMVSESVDELCHLLRFYPALLTILDVSFDIAEGEFTKVCEDDADLKQNADAVITIARKAFEAQRQKQAQVSDGRDDCLHMIDTFHKLDRNHEGSLSKEQFHEWTGLKDMALDTEFERLDTDDDGRLSLMEFREAYRCAALSQVTGHKSVNLNQNGCISETEYDNGNPAATQESKDATLGRPQNGEDRVLHDEKHKGDAVAVIFAQSDTDGSDASSEDSSEHES